MVDGLTSGELAKRSGVKLQTVRYYERRGLLPKPPRTQAGYRKFPGASVGRIRFIKRAQELGFQLSEIQELLSLRVDPHTTCADIKIRAEAKIDTIEARINHLRDIQRALVRLASKCRGVGPVGDCPILEELDTQEAV